MHDVLDAQTLQTLRFDMHPSPSLYFLVGLAAYHVLINRKKYAVVLVLGMKTETQSELDLRNLTLPLVLQIEESDIPYLTKTFDP